MCSWTYWAKLFAMHEECEAMTLAFGIAFWDIALQVFSQWKDALLVVSKALSAHSIGSVSLTGGRQGKVVPLLPVQKPCIQVIGLPLS